MHTNVGSSAMLVQPGVTSKFHRSDTMPHGSSDECDRWHNLEMELKLLLQTRLSSLEETKSLLQQNELELIALNGMCKVATEELKTQRNTENGVDNYYVYT